ncbi:hypothetical protein ACWDR3_04825 [Streptomyces sp. NPDC001002]
MWTYPKGAAAGTCLGFVVQADAEPTSLPSLSQAPLTRAKGPGPEPLSAAQDRQVKVDGDLRKLLLKKPAGAKNADWLELPDDGWEDLAAYADEYEDADEMFGTLAVDEFRRAAVTSWESGQQTVEIHLVQFRQEESAAAADTMDNNQYWADSEHGTDSWSLPGTGGGKAYVHNKPHTEDGYLPVYSAEAHAFRGDVAMEMWVYDTRPISKSKIMDLANRQMERL